MEIHYPGRKSFRGLAWMKEKPLCRIYFSILTMYSRGPNKRGGWNRRGVGKNRNFNKRGG